MSVDPQLHVASKARTNATKPTITSGLPPEIKDLGRKARSRLEEEKSKRKEIVVLNSLETVDAKANEKSEVDATAARVAKKTASPRKRRKSVPSRQLNHDLDEQIDPWLPDISHLVSRDKGETLSNVVRLHGLPLGTTVAQIRRFVMGLNPQRILLLPSYPICIHAWDAVHGGTNDGPQQPMVPRMPAHVRVYLKFDSHLTAALAVKRSGEVLPPDGIVAVEPAGDSDESLRGVRIAVTQLPKRLATYLVRHLAIDAIGSESLEDMLARIEAQLNPVVPRILWTATRRDLRIELDDHERDDLYFDLYPDTTDASTLLERATLSEHASRLKQERDTLYYQLPFPSIVCLDPQLATDPVLRLTSSAIHLLGREQKRAHEAMARARQREWLDATATTAQDFELEEAQVHSDSEPDFTL